MTTPDPDESARECEPAREDQRAREDERAPELTAGARDAGDATGWFERLYAAAEAGDVVVPWDRGSPHRLLVQWAEQRGITGNGRRAVVVGCGLGDDAEYIAGLGFDTVGFDISASAIRGHGAVIRTAA